MRNERILRLLIAHLLCALALTSGLAAEKKAAAPPQEGGRFLFVVETSTAMAPFEHAGGQTVFDLIFSGLDGQMQPKDTIGIWTFGEEVHAGLFPMQVWTPEQKARVATEAGMFLKDQHHDRQAHLDRVIRKVLPLVVAVKDVNIFIVSGNEVTWKGTTFDRDINVGYQKRAAESRKAKQPLITTLVARNGDIVSWGVTLAGEPIALPERKAPGKLVQADPARETKSANSNELAKAAAPLISSAPATAAPAQPEKPEVRASNTQATASSPAPANSALRTFTNELARVVPPVNLNAPPAPAPASASETPRVPKMVIITKPITNEHPDAAVAQASVTPTAQTKAENPKSEIEKSESGKSIVPAPVATKLEIEKAEIGKSLPPVTIQSAVVSDHVAPASLVANQAKSISSLLPNIVAPMAVSAREAPPASNSPARASSTPPSLAMVGPLEPTFTPRRLFLIGSVLTGIAVALLFLVARALRPAPQPSFITRSFDRKN